MTYLTSYCFIMGWVTIPELYYVATTMVLPMNRWPVRAAATVPRAKPSLIWRAPPPPPRGLDAASFCATNFAALEGYQIRLPRTRAHVNNAKLFA